MDYEQRKIRNRKCCHNWYLRNKKRRAIIRGRWTKNNKERMNLLQYNYRCKNRMKINNKKRYVRLWNSVFNIGKNRITRTIIDNKSVYQTIKIYDKLKIREKNRLSYLRNKGKRKEANKNWFMRNKDKKRFYDRKRRSKHKKLKEEFTLGDWKMKLELTGGICPNCKIYIGCNKLTIDHTPPISRAPENFVYKIEDISPLCISCNSSKGNKLLS